MSGKGYELLTMLIEFRMVADVQNIKAISVSLFGDLSITYLDT